MTATIIILILSAILALVLLTAAVISYLELRRLNRQRETMCALLDDGLTLKYNAMDAHRKMLRTFYSCRKDP